MAKITAFFIVVTALKRLPQAHAEKVLLLAEPGSGAHAFTAILATMAEERFAGSYSLLVSWDPCAVARRRRLEGGRLIFIDHEIILYCTWLRAHSRMK